MASAVQRAIQDYITINSEWWPDWLGQSCAIVASGPSAKAQPLELLRDKVRVIAINESWQLCKWADVLYGCDAKWWGMKLGVPDFRGIKIASDATQYRDVRRVTVDPLSNSLCLDQPGHLGAGGNSGFQALNLAVQFGTSQILLIGFDMRVDLGEHWHPRHYPPLSNPHPHDNLPRWRSALDGAAATLQRLNVRVVNCSPVSALKAYPKMTIEEALWASP